MGEVVLDFGDRVNAVAILLSVICTRKTERLPVTKLFPRREVDGRSGTEFRGGIA